jgi:death on curing protein
MNEPTWLDVTFLKALQVELLAQFGGLEGVRDEGLLASAINRPVDLFHYESPTIFELAASYTLGIVKNHPFLDGNKRAGFMAAYTFLGANGYSLEGAEEDAVLQTVGLAAGEISAEDYAQWLETNCKAVG